MGIMTARAEFDDILEELLLSMTVGFIFDEVHIISQLSAMYPDSYFRFCALFADRDSQPESAAEAILSAIGEYEGILVEEQNIKAHFPTLYNSLTSHKVWKRV